VAAPKRGADPSQECKLCTALSRTLGFRGALHMIQHQGPNEPNAQHNRDMDVTNAVVHLWLAIQHLEAAHEIDVSADIRAIMEGLAQKHNLPVVEADAFANGKDDI
jgi:hypothetical protein